MNEEIKRIKKEQGGVEPRTAQDDVSGQGLSFGEKAWDAEIAEEVIDFVIERANCINYILNFPEPGTDGDVFLFCEDCEGNKKTIAIGYCEDGSKYNNAMHYLLEVYEKDTILKNIEEVQ